MGGSGISLLTRRGDFGRRTPGRILASAAQAAVLEVTHTAGYQCRLNEGPGWFRLHMLWRFRLRTKSVLEGVYKHFTVECEVMLWTVKGAQGDRMSVMKLGSRPTLRQAFLLAWPGRHSFCPPSKVHARLFSLGRPIDDQSYREALIRGC